MVFYLKIVIKNVQKSPILVALILTTLLLCDGLRRPPVSALSDVWGTPDKEVDHHVRISNKMIDRNGRKYSFVDFFSEIQFEVAIKMLLQIRIKEWAKCRAKFNFGFLPKKFTWF